VNYELIKSGEFVIVEGNSPLSSASQALDLISLCAEHGTDRLLLDTPVLPEAFFELQTRFAGEFMQKLQNYQLRAALVISPDRSYSDRFNEWLLEAKRGRTGRLFTSRGAALEWLASVA
jgi:hypothetical protein